MAELITFLLALPILHGIGVFYLRLGIWVYRASKDRLCPQTSRDWVESPCVTEAIGRQDHRYDHALSAAITLLGKLDREPGMPGPDRLAVAAYSILDSLDQWEAGKEVGHARFQLK